MPNLFDQWGRPISTGAPADYSHRLVDGDRADDGVQWSDEVSTIDAVTDYMVLEGSIDHLLLNKKEMRGK
jgi:hypothetical protein